MRTIIAFCLFTAFASASTDENFDGHSSSFMLNHTKDAFLSYEPIKESTDQLIKRLERKLLGDYAKEALLLAPLITGKVEFKVNDVRVYFDAKANNSGLEYVYKF